MKLTNYLIGALYVLLIPALLLLAREYARQKTTITKQEHQIDRLNRRLHKAEKFKAECPCCFILPAEQESR